LTYLIQRTKTREYFLQGRWTLDSGWAQQFANLAQAIGACLEHELRDVELVLQFGFEVGRLCSLHLTLPQQLFAWQES
jgi:hypothetical protein